MHQKKVGFFGAVFFCARGTAAAQCDAGYYLENGECKKCNPNYEQFYCPGDDIRHPCPTTDTDYEKLSGWKKISGREAGWAYGGAKSAVSCLGIMRFQDSYGNKVLVECPFNGENYWCDRRSWYETGNGYYLAGYKSTSYEDWYSSVRGCTNAPANAHYTGPGTPDAPDGSVVDANDCPWVCDAGYYQNGNTCVLCEDGYYCPGDNSRMECPWPGSDKFYMEFGDYSYKRGYSAPGASQITQCYVDRDMVDMWIFEYQYRGFYRFEGKCYYSTETEIYNNCESKKYFSECNAGFFIDDSVAMNGEFENSCTPCSPGTYTAALGVFDVGNDGSFNDQTSCTPCAVGTYADQMASTSCAQCTNAPANATYTGGAATGACPWKCNAGFARYDDACLAICPTGISAIKTSTGLSIPLFAEKQTTPALNVEYAGAVCYGSLALGAVTGAININIGGQIYHTVQ